jgi:hypothetical protein
VIVLVPDWKNMLLPFYNEKGKYKNRHQQILGVLVNYLNDSTTHICASASLWEKGKRFPTKVQRKERNNTLSLCVSVGG